MPFDFDSIFTGFMEKHNLDTVVILGHMNPDGDAAGCVMGLAHYLHMNYPAYQIFPYLADTLEVGPLKLVKKDRVFHPFQKPLVKNNYLCLICDTATVKRIIGEEYYQHATASIVIDHHESNEGYADINYTHIAESCAENVFDILKEGFLRKAAEEAHPNALDYIYMGMLHDTKCFDRATPKMLDTAHKILSMGVDHQYVKDTMYWKTTENLFRQSLLLLRVRKALDGRLAYVMVTEEERIRDHIEYEDIHSISDILRECEDVEIGLTLYEQETNLWRCSARSDGRRFNVSNMMKCFGGGGHSGAAGLKYKTDDPEHLIREIIDYIATHES